MEVHAPGASVRQQIEATAAAVGRLDTTAMAAARTRLDNLTKPRGSLGRLEELAVQIAGITESAAPTVEPACLVLMAADHGVTEEGVSAYPAEVTPQMVRNFLAGGAAINVFARRADLRVRVIDMGIARPLDEPGLETLAPRRGTRNLARGPAMTRDEAETAVLAGIRVAEEEAARGTRLLALGEMGIGNTTASSAIVAALTGLDATAVVGGGTGIDAQGRQRKIAAVRAALEVNRPRAGDAIDVLHKVGGLEIAGLAGFILGAAAHRLPVLLDGFITGAAALIAQRLEPRVAAFCIAGHRSQEAGHRHVLERLALTPLLELELRLGEGSGAALAYPLLVAAVRTLHEMATFESAGVSGALGEAPQQDGPAAPSAIAYAGMTQLQSQTRAGSDFSEAERAGVYKAIFRRRDIRHFRPDPLPDSVLLRLLDAAHHAPSVGFMQPWNFVVIRQQAIKQALRDVVERERQAQALYFQGQKAQLFPRLKVEGILEAPVVICVTSDPTRGGPHVLGRNSDPATDVYSVSCAIQNLWLAARAEGVAVGWVTFYKKADVRTILHIPPHVDPIALLCVGYTDEFPERPILETAGWERRRRLEDLVFQELWPEAVAARATASHNRSNESID